MINQENDWSAILTDLLKNKSQRALAEEIGVTQMQVWRWKSGTTVPIKPYQKVLLEMWKNGG